MSLGVIGTVLSLNPLIIREAFRQTLTLLGISIRRLNPLIIREAFRHEFGGHWYRVKS